MRPPKTRRIPLTRLPPGFWGLYVIYVTFSVATWPHFAVFYCYVRRSTEIDHRMQDISGKEKGTMESKGRGNRSRPRHNVVMTDAAIKDNYDSGNRFYFSHVPLLFMCPTPDSQLPSPTSWLNPLPKAFSAFHVVVLVIAGSWWGGGVAGTKVDLGAVSTFTFRVTNVA